ncbi:MULTISPECIES: hypothetical protein [unclassified Mesorhizobium]|uniref:hypothetical protein n=1 Tax=unclassified Mesorhizobium TaxID=325217 RepID=UPI0024151D19|nr:MULTISPECIES: hypothetical protein [unclassified Mesorhizobium]MDG4854580.1 hypothetical protein [Mesorhizobium sp. WSM4982]MDG4889613.1 hypothetical protein [Mesorhizobium sp. WSM4887]MDG4916098.1 hypothetical protein [Mesorhizobium sp. WSM4983]
MPALVTINGVAVDQDDPCALYQALYAVKLRALAGEHVEELSIQSPVTREQLRFSGADIKALDAELMRLSAACSAKNGKRSRYAKTMRFIR